LLTGQRWQDVIFYVLPQETKDYFYILPLRHDEGVESEHITPEAAKLCLEALKNTVS